MRFKNFLPFLIWAVALPGISFAQLNLTEDVASNTSILDLFAFNAKHHSIAGPLIRSGTSTDLELTGSVTPVSVASGGNATYTFNIVNKGAAIASDVTLLHYPPKSTMLISVSPSSGMCHLGDGKPINQQSLEQGTRTAGTVYCEIGDLVPSGTATVTVTVKTPVVGDGVDTRPLPVQSEANLFPKTEDINPTNNFISLSFNLIPSTNKPPVVKITSPTADRVLKTAVNNPAIIPLRIAAFDTDGTISEVKVYDSGTFVGNAISAGNDTYTLDFSTSQTGYHSIEVSATDSGGRETWISEQFRIDSPHTLSIVKPTHQLIAPGSNIEIETESILAGSSIRKIELYDRGILLGTLDAASNTGHNYIYRFTYRNVPKGRHTLIAILTDLTGATTVSEPFEFKATVLPTISLTAPSNSTTFPENRDVNITAKIGDADGYVQEVKFYANGELIGTHQESITSGSTTFKWISPEAGVYSIRAMATDDTDEVAWSNIIKIRVSRLVVGRWRKGSLSTRP